MDKTPKLFILPALQLELAPDSTVLLSQQFVDGMLKYVELWPGQVKALMQVAPSSTTYTVLDQKAFRAEDLPFEVEVVSYDTLSATMLSQASVVLAAANDRQNHISQLCRSVGVPCVYITEYSLKTRKQTIAVHTKNPLLRWRRIHWELNQERKRQQAIALAEGVQCNGTPTYAAYRAINPNPLLFFDTRVTAAMLANDSDIEHRHQRLDQETMPLRLMFSGRLVAEKGADHLIDVAMELKQLKVPFQFFICGDGVLKESMQKRIEQGRLSDCVKLMGVLDFQHELVPFIKHNIDLFVCCHRQGDPSCTYLETLACGVPIVGYTNEAFVGIERASQTGWVVPMNQPKLLAQQIAKLNADRPVIKEMALRSLAFARSHTFEQAFAARVKHLVQIAFAHAGGTQLDSSAWSTMPLRVLDTLMPKNDRQPRPRPSSSC